MRTIAVTALLLALALAGCSDAPASPEKVQQQAEEAGAVAPLPPWSVGDYWTYETKFGGSTGTTSYIAYAQSGSNWLMGTNEKSTALYEARSDSAFQGEIRGSDLAGNEEGRFVKFFDFPLEHNKTWNTVWDGVSLHVVTHNIGPGEFHMVAHADGKMWADWMYTNDARWLHHVNFYDENETVTGSLALIDNGSDFSGTLYSYEVDEWIHQEYKAGVEHKTDFSVAGDWNEVFVVVHAFCMGDAHGSIIGGLNGPSEDQRVPPMIPEVNEPQMGVEVDCDAAQFDMDSMEFKNGPGTWEIGSIVAAQNGKLTLDFEPRKLTSTPFP